MLIFLSPIYHKVFFMFSSSFSLYWVCYCHAHQHIFWFRYLRKRLRACDVARILVALFPYIFVHTNSQMPGALIRQTGRYNSETVQVIDRFDIGHDLVIWQNCYVNSRWSRELGQRYSSRIPRTKRKMFVPRSVRYFAKLVITWISSHIQSLPESVDGSVSFWIHLFVEVATEFATSLNVDKLLLRHHSTAAGDPTKYKQ